MFVSAEIKVTISGVLWLNQLIFAPNAEVKLMVAGL
jgi:hypothetical protein